MNGAIVIGIILHVFIVYGATVNEAIVNGAIVNGVKGTQKDSK